MANLMGFKKVDKLPERSHKGVYDDLLHTVEKTGDIYALDTKDVKRTQSLTVTLRNRIKKLGLHVKVITRGTNVCVVRTASVEDISQIVYPND